MYLLKENDGKKEITIGDLSNNHDFPMKCMQYYTDNPYRQPAEYILPFGPGYTQLFSQISIQKEHGKMTAVNAKR